MPPQRLVLDANVLYSETLTDVFLSLAAADLVTIIWSDRLREEWTLALARNRPDLPPHWIARRRQHLEAAPNWSCITIDAAVVERLVLPDTNDRHVLAAALQATAMIIVTANLGDFPARTLDAYGISARTADAIMCQLLDNAPDGTMAALPLPKANSDDVLEQLRRAGLARFVKALRRHLGT